MKVERSELVQIVIDNLNIMRENPDIENDVKKQLAKHGITEGYTGALLINPNQLNEIDIRIVGLLLEQLYVKTGNKELDPKKYFTRNEMIEMRQYYHTEESDELQLPLTLENVSIVGNGVYNCVISSKLVAQLMESKLLYYNFDIQRQPKKEKRMDKVVLKPTIYRKNVEEIRDLILKGELVDTTLAFNAVIGSSVTGEELTYDSKTRTLTINEGTRLDILDGMHRSLGALEAYHINKDAETFFTLRLSNHTTRQAQLYQAQLAKATPIPKTRIQELEANRHADTVVQYLKSDSELRGKISSSHTVTTTAGEWVSYNTLADTIDEYFDMQTRLDAITVGQYLAEFFDYLVDYAAKNEDLSNLNNSLLLYNKMFAGYIVLAKRMQDEGIELINLTKILEGIDFSRNNPLWAEIGIISEGKITPDAEKKIKEYFKNFKLTTDKNRRVKRSTNKKGVVT